jgi:hypothetical protein
LDDVEDIRTYNKRTNTYTDGVSLLAWNFYYPDNDKKVYTQNILLDEFKFPVFNGISNINSQIEIYQEPSTLESSQF